MRTSTHNEVGCVLVCVGEREKSMRTSTHDEVGCVLVRMGVRGTVCKLVRMGKGCRGKGEKGKRGKIEQEGKEVF